MNIIEQLKSEYAEESSPSSESEPENNRPEESGEEPGDEAHPKRQRVEPSEPEIPDIFAECGINLFSAPEHPLCGFTFCLNRATGKYCNLHNQASNWMHVLNIISIGASAPLYDIWE